MQNNKKINMCDTKIKKKEWPCSVKTASERSRDYRQRLKLKREIEKCFQIASGKYVEKRKVKNPGERQREYRQRQKSKCELDKCALEAPGICLKSEMIKSAEERLRDYKQRQKLKRELKKLDEGGSTLKNRSEKETKTSEERNQECRQSQKLIYDLEKYCDGGSMSGEDSEHGDQEYGQQTKECGVEKRCKGESTRKEHLAKDTATSVEQNPDYPRPKLKKGLEKCIEPSSICANIVRTYNSSAEYLFHSMIEQ